MNTIARPLLLLVLTAFGIFSGAVMLEHGYMGIWRAGFTSSASLQLLLDLVICASLVMVWMIRDAREHGRTVWPFVLLTLAAGSFGPLLYLLLAPRRA